VQLKTFGLKDKLRLPASDQYLSKLSPCQFQMKKPPAVAKANLRRFIPSILSLPQPYFDQ
jgi:hypothetical protein